VGGRFRKEVIGDCTLYLGDCLEILPTLGKFDACVTDPPYGVTALDWDRRARGWERLIDAPHLWCFGSLRFFLSYRFEGWKYAQEVVWEKHNGSNSHADRFRRVHELAVHFYRGDWSGLHKETVYTHDATARAVRRKARPPHFGNIGASSYASADGGPRMMRSVIYAPSCHGEAEHPTQKPVAVVSPLVQYSAPPGSTVLDPFMGSGTTGVACARLGRRFAGVEINAAYFETACRRIEAVYRQGDLARGPRLPGRRSAERRAFLARPKNGRSGPPAGRRGPGTGDRAGAWQSS
jgi:site-specific DNA-methyltransferase (adenine-specific)